MMSARRRLVAVCALALAAASPAGAQGPGRASLGVAVGGLPLPGLAGNTFSGSFATAIASHFSLRAVQWFELPRREGIFLVAMAGTARVTGDDSRRPSVVLVYELGGGIMFPAGESASISIEARRVRFPRRFEESAVWPVTIGVHF